MRKTLIILTVAIVIGVLHAKAAQAQQHDHQDWNLMSIGRIVALARTNSCVEEGTPDFVCGVDASHEAMIKMDEVLNTFDCTEFGKDVRPEVSRAVPFTRHDFGPVVIAELADVSCRTLPSTQLVPVEPQEFKKYCSRLEWKCDTVWIPDSDPSVWYIGVLADIPHSH
jgi:hypothetical protein